MKVSLSLMFFTVALICSTSVCKDDKINKTVSVVPNSTIGVVTTEDMQSITDYFSDHMGAVKRALYVIIGITAVVALYLGIRTYRFVDMIDKNNCYLYLFCF